LKVANLVFPEFGRRVYRPPEGGALVFFMRRAASGDAGHQRAALCLSGVPLWRGRREKNAKPTMRGCMPAETHYTGMQDRLFPTMRKSEA